MSTRRPQPSAPKLTPTLEDYLETIYRLLRQEDRARVRDIMRIRGVKAGSVTPAIKRLAEQGLVDYVQREHIALTPAGEQAARQVFARHLLLKRFFAEILELDAAEAEENACAMEHSLTPGAMDRLAHFFERLERRAVCPTEQNCQGGSGVSCDDGYRDDGQLALDCPLRPLGATQGSAESPVSDAVSLASGQVGRCYRIVEICGLTRGRLLDLGLLPGATLTLEQRSSQGALMIRHQQSSFSLSNMEATDLHVLEIDIP